MTKWTIPEGRRVMTDADMANLTRRLADTAIGQGKDADRYAAALRQIITEAPSLQYAQGIARDVLYPKEGGE